MQLISKYGSTFSVKASEIQGKPPDSNNIHLFAKLHRDSREKLLIDYELS
jgi:hypothetical protein